MHNCQINKDINKEKILASIKKLLLIDDEYTVFDEDIKIHINTVLANLTQMGVGPYEGFAVITGEETWDQFISDQVKLQQVKTYVYLKVRLLFDPPTNSFTLESFTKQAYELEVRLYTASGGY